MGTRLLGGKLSYEATARPQLAADVGVARLKLAQARTQLDLAVAELPASSGDEEMATPELMSVLFDVVSAKEGLDRLEAQLGAGGDRR